MRLYVILCIILYTGTLTGQIPPSSPLGALVQRVGNTTISVSYERPSARGRVLFGGLVPYDEVWRTGAGYCTKIGFDRPVTVAKQRVSAGRYSLFTIPGKTEWIVILNADTTLYSAKDYDREKDVVRFRVPVTTTTRFYEALTIDIDVIPDNARLYLSWGHTQVSFPVETSTATEVAAHVERLLSEPLSADADYGWPAEHLLLQNGDLNVVRQLIERQFAVEESEYAWRLRMMLNDRLGHADRALAAIRGAIAFRQANPLDEQNQAWSLAYWRDELAKRQ